MNGQHPLSANKSGCLSVSTDVLLQASQLLLTEEERDVPTWSRSHPLLIELLSLSVMDVRKVLQLYWQKKKKERKKGKIKLRRQSGRQC